MASDADTAKKIFVRTYGCQMNVYDSTRMIDVMAQWGYRETAAIEDADLVVVNTCHIREKAAEKTYSELGRLRRLKDEKARQGRRMILAVAGCVAQAEGYEVLRRAPYVDVVLGPQTYHRLGDLVARAERGTRGNGLVDTDFPTEVKFDRLPEENLARGVSAFLAVQEGCDKFCSFCVVPYTRGAEYSRAAADILAEARRLVAQGAREITLLGQNVNAYHGAAPGGGREWSLARLIRELAGIDNLARIRFTTSHPKDMDDDLIAAHGEVPQLMPYLHLPAQSGSDRILGAMNRRYDRAHYRDLVARLRASRPDLALSSDFIVGFPGETDRDFADTLDLVEEIGFSQAFSFKYSTRPGTPAAAADGQVDEGAKQARLETLQALLRRQQDAFNLAQVGRTLPVLIDRKGRYPGQMAGRTPYLQPVHATLPAAALGRVLAIRIEALASNSLSGRAVLCEDGPGPAPGGHQRPEEPTFG